MPFDVLGKSADVTIATVAHSLVRARGDGNCLFHAAGHLLDREGGILPMNVTGYDELRTAVVARVALGVKTLTNLGYRLRDQMGIHNNHLTQNNTTLLTTAQTDQIDDR